MSHAASALGIGGHTADFVDISRSLGLGLAAVLSVALLLRSNRRGEIEALGWSLLLFVILGPVVWPWYETWGFVVLAVVAEGWTLRLVLALSAVACFADVPGTRSLGAPDPWLTVICWVVLAGAAGAYAAVRIVPSLPHLKLPARSRASRAPRSTPSGRVGD
jgi:alpha-1,6-mannosyltransferase